MVMRLLRGAPEGLDAPDQVEVSIVLPCLNEAPTVGQCVRDALAWLTESGTAGEVVVVDNGSTDGSDDLARAAGARVVYEPERGKGNAMRRGVAAARGRYLVMADADGTYDLRHLDDLLAPLTAGSDLVTGNRLRGLMEPGSMPWLHRHVGNPLFSAVVSLITGRPFGDCLSGLRAFRREAWEAMAPRASGFELESEICLRAGRRRLRTAEVAVPYSARRARSKLRAVTHGWQIARFILLDSADLLLVPPALIAILVGIVALLVGTLDAEGVEVGSSRWQPVFAAGILIPGGTALLTAAIAAKWLAWRRGIQAPTGLLRLAMHPGVPAFEICVGAGLVALAAGLGLDGYLLYRWGSNNPPPLPLGLGAVAQSLVVTGLNLVVAALLIGALRASTDFSPIPPSGAAATLPGEAGSEEAFAAPPSARQ